MALLFIDGFDHYVSADFLKKWTSSPTASVVILPSNGRRGGGCLQINSTGDCLKAVPPSGTLICGQAIYTPLIGNFNLLAFLDGQIINQQVTIVCDSTGRLVVSRGSTVLGTSASVIPANSWVYVEAKVVFSNTGSFEIRVNGVNVLSNASIDTTNTANNTSNGIGMGYGVGSSNSGSSYRDDLYICDGTGTTNNDFLGDVRIDTLYPNGDGNYSQFTPSTGTTHYTLVDETAPNTTDYNDGANVGDRDSYAMSNLPALTSQTIFGVQVNAAMLKDDAGPRTAATFVRSASTNTDGAAVGLSTSQLYTSQVFELNPNGSIAWTETTVNAMEAGVKVTA